MGLRRWKTVCAMAAVATSAVACSPNEISYFVRQNQAGTLGTMGAACTYDSNPSSSAYNSGVMDVALSNRYVLVPLFENRMFSTADPAAFRADTRGVFVDRMHIHLNAPVLGTDLSLPNGAPIDYDVPANVYVPVGTSPGTPGYASGQVEVIPATVGDALYARFCGAQPRAATRGACTPTAASSPVTVIVQATPYGRTNGGIGTGLGSAVSPNGPGTFAGGEFRFPLTVCCGCLIGFSSGSSNAAPGTQANCNATLSGMGTTSSAFSSSPCYLGQDIAVDCRLCSSTNIWCQPPGYCVP